MEIELYTPHPAQQVVHESCADETFLFSTLITGRQFGKTELAMNQALMWALGNEDVVVMWVAPTSSQTHKVYKNILKGIEGAPFVKSNKGSSGDIEIVFTNGSIIKFKSAAAEDGLRGETVHYMICDEAAFIKETTFMEILLPMLNVKGRKCLVITTPKGKNWVHKHYMNGISGDTDYQSFRFTSSDNPYANKKIIEAARKSLPDAMFRQEYLSEFVDGGSIIENIEELCILPNLRRPLPKQRYYVGIDIALKNDFTVFSVVDSQGNLVAYDRFNQITGPQLKERLVKNLNLWKPEHALIEVNNMGGVIYDDLVQIYGVKNLSQFTTTSKSKNEIITNLINAFASKSIKCVNDEIVKSELEVFEMKITASGNVRYCAADGYHDDIVMATAIAREAQGTVHKNKVSFKFLN